MEKKLALAVILAFSFLFSGCGLFTPKEKVVGTDISVHDFQEFYYTYSTTANPSVFQRYRFYIEDGKPMFSHEKREGNTVFLTEDDITIQGTMALSEEDFTAFWSYMCRGKVTDRDNSNTSGGSGPWLYLYWNGDQEKCQQFTFTENGTLPGFEAFCIGLKEKQLQLSVGTG